MHFGYSLRGTKASWKKFTTKLNDMITQSGCTKSLFTLSAFNTSWIEFHNLMPRNAHSRPQNENHKRIQDNTEYFQNFLQR